MGIIKKKFNIFLRIITYLLFKVIFQNKTVSPPVNKYQIKRVLILRYDKIGDMVTTLPSIDFIKKLIPDVQIDVLASTQNYLIIKNDPRVSNIYICENKKLKLIRKAYYLRKNNYNLIFAFVFYKTSLGGLIANLAGKKNTIKVTIEHEKRKKIYYAFFNLLVPSESFIQYKCMLEVLVNIVCYTFGVEYDQNKIHQKIYLDDSSIYKAKKFINSLPHGEFILINLSAGHPLREWSKENYIELIEHLIKNYPTFFYILISAPSRFSESLSISSNFSGKAFSFHSSSILDVVSIVPYCKMVITPDTSIVHISSVFSKPMIVLFSRFSTNIENWKPYRVPYRALQTLKKEKIDAISPLEVFYAFKSLYSELETENQSNNQ